MFACLYLPPGCPSPAPALATGVPAPLLALARDFSPRVEAIGDHLIVLDVSGLHRLLGDATTVGRELRRAAADRGIHVHIALAAAGVTAILMAIARAGVTIVPPGAEADFLSPLPLRILEHIPSTLAGGHGSRSGPSQGGVDRAARLAPDGAAASRHPGTSSRHYRMAPSPSEPLRAAASRPWKGAAQELLIDEELIAALKRWGLKTLGDLTALPSTDLSERLGQAGLAVQRLARGEDPRPLVPAAVEEPFEESMALEWPIEGFEPLSFVLSRLFDALCAKLERADSGVAVLHLRLRLVTKEVHERSLQLPAPFRDPRVLRTLALLDLESHPPGAGIDHVMVAVDRTPGRVLQFSLLERALPSAEEVSTLLARLQALLGADRCGAARVVDTHRPGAFEMRPFSVEPLRSDSLPARRSSHAPPLVGTEIIPRPTGLAFRRFRVPLLASVRVRDGRPVSVRIGHREFPGGRVEACAGPWRSSGDWWRLDAGARDAVPWNRDEWDVALSDGGIYRIYEDRAGGKWFVEGVGD